MHSTIGISMTMRRRHSRIRGCMIRIAFTAFAIAGVLAAATRGVEAQEARGRWEVIVPSGTLVPTGTQRDAIKRSGLTAVQLSYVMDPAVAVTVMVGWGRSRDVAAERAPKLDVFTYDVGAELRAPQWWSGRVLSFSPFAGAGAGGRSYNYRSLDVDARHNLAAYASVGGTVGWKRLHVKLEARNYVTGFQPLDGAGAADARNDVALLFGLRIGTR